MCRRLVLVSVALLAFASTPARAQAPALLLIPPVDAPVSRAFDAPLDRYSSGHRGIDYNVPAGTAVRSAADGTVVFAGPVAGDLAVTVAHTSGIETTYSKLSSVDVASGAVVRAGGWLGRSGTSHGSAGLHFGVKVDDTYVDPASLLGPVDVAGAIHLAPLVLGTENLGGLARILPPTSSAGSATRGCKTAGPLDAQKVPPNDNIAVAVAGITSKTKDGVDAEIYERGLPGLGYATSRIYWFSYAGVEGPRLHEPYERTDTYGDLRRAAARLRATMVAIHQRHPDAQVDLLAHSQGGVVARLYLSEYATEWDASLPRVDHLVTFATPHAGAPAAAEIPQLDRRTRTGSVALDAASRVATSGAPVPDPRSVAVSQLASSSEVMASLAAEDVSLGTRVLTLAIPNDPVVPADRASIPGEASRIVGWEGHPFAGHSAIVGSDEARAVAYSFLRDSAPTCTTGWDRTGRMLGRAWSYGQSHLDTIYRGIEDALGPPP